MVKRKVSKGFQKASSFLGRITQKGFEKKGFSQSKLLTHWSETVGPEVARYSKPLRITFDSKSLSSTLTLEINGAYGPELKMQREAIREKINRLYGYNAVSRINMRVSSKLGYDEVSSEELRQDEKIKKVGEKMDGVYHNDSNDKLLTKCLQKINDKNLRDSLITLCRLKKSVKQEDFKRVKEYTNYV